MANELMSVAKSEIVVYQPDDTLRLDVALNNDTVWLNQQQMGELFGRERSVIAKHIRNAFSEGELNQRSVCAKFAQTASDGKTYQVDFYNLIDNTTWHIGASPKDAGARIFALMKMELDPAVVLALLP